jgi:hypothetical protein
MREVFDADVSDATNGAGVGPLGDERAECAGDGAHDDSLAAFRTAIRGRLRFGDALDAAANRRRGSRGDETDHPPSFDVYVLAAPPCGGWGLRSRAHRR